MSGKDKVEVIVTADEDTAHDLQNCADRLSAAGMDVTSVLDFIGQVTGRIAKKDAKKLRRIKGVASVEIAGEVELPPPDEDVQ